MNAHQVTNSRRYRRLLPERLEDRDLLAGNVVGAVAAGTLTLLGDPAANVLNIHAGSSPGQVVVEGQNGTKLGSPSVTTRTFNGVQSISVDLRGGNDSLTISNLQLSRNLSIVMGAGDDRVEFQPVLPSLPERSAQILNGVAASVSVGRTTLIDTGAGNDMVEFRSFSGAGNVTILLGSGNDGLNSYLDSSNLPLVAGSSGSTLNGIPGLRTTNGANVFADLGSGDDAASLEGVAVAGSLNLQGGLGNDSVYLNQATIGSGLVVETCQGSDRVSLVGVEVAKDTRIDTGAGDEETVGIGMVVTRDLRVADSGGSFTGVSLSLVSARDVTVALGASNDEVYAYLSTFRDLSIITNGGDDRVVIGGQAGAPGILPQQATGQGVEVTRRTLIDTGSGADELSLLDSVFATLSIYLGAGDDQAFAGNTYADWLFADGGPGYDRGVNAGGNDYGVEYNFSFEEIITII